VFSCAASAEQNIPGSTLKLEEVTVTAQRRQESIKDVPVSIATLSGQELDTVFSSGDDIRALANRSPGLYVESSNGRIAPRFYMRGLGNVDFDLAASQPVSVVFDNVVQENVILKSFPIFDVDQVEVIRGPQGTLFGRNTTAGIVKFDSRKPTQIPEGYIRANYGTYNTVNVETAVGGPLLQDSLAGRVSLLFQNREDWIDNRYTGETNAFGGHREMAGRAQLLYQPNPEFSALLNYHARDLDGSQTAFMANVFTTGSNELNENYSRDSVYYNGGNNNTQKYKGSGSSLTLTWNVAEVELTSITGYERARGSNTGDIDGGVAGDGPGFIPFDSETVDAGDIEQTTQEVRIRNTNSSAWQWQAGVFLFDSTLSVTTDTGFNVATVHHDNQSWAVFAHNSLDLTEALTLGFGLRYTDDQKTFSAEGHEEINVQDDQVSWDISLNYAVTPSTNLYTRVADSFRAPSIQGRDVAFFGEPSVAGSESILSYEVGAKSDVFNNRLRLNAAFFYYTIDGFQLSAIGGATNSNRLLNADKGVGKGFEVDLAAVPTDRLKVTLGFSYNDTEIRDPGLHTAVCGSGQCTPTNPLNSDGHANIHGNPFPGAPDSSLNFTLRYQIPTASGGVWYAFTDWVYQGRVNLALYESEEFVTDPQFEGGLRLGFEHPSRGYDFAVFGRNITDEHNVKGFIDFNNNTGFVNEPRVVGVEARYSF
jgi:iron complex outermembrane recepter protein